MIKATRRPTPDLLSPREINRAHSMVALRAHVSGDEWLRALEEHNGAADAIRARLEDAGASLVGNGLLSGEPEAYWFYRGNTFDIDAALAVARDFAQDLLLATSPTRSPAGIGLAAGDVDMPTEWRRFLNFPFIQLSDGFVHVDFRSGALRHAASPGSILVDDLVALELRDSAAIGASVTIGLPGDLPPLQAFELSSLHGLDRVAAQVPA